VVKPDRNIPVFYREEMLADSGSFSPSAGKPRHVVAAWSSARLPIRIDSLRLALGGHYAPAGF
jgi:hypothetical protein